MATVAESLFGVTPESLQQERQNALLNRGIQLAQLDPFEQAYASIYAGAGNIGRGVGGLLGAKDPELEKATTLQGIIKTVDASSPEGMIEASRKLAAAGLGQYAIPLVQQAQTLKEKMAKAGLEANKLTMENQLRAELAALPPDATDEDVLKVVTKYGSADKVMAVRQASADRAAQRDTQLKIAEQQIEGRLQLAQLQGATQQQIALMQIEGRKEIAQLTAALKPPSPAVLKALEKAEKIAEGKEGLGQTIDVATALVNDIAEKGGMTTTSKSGLANLITSLGTGKIGQTIGRATGSEVQSKRDELASIRLQLLNAVKEATGMTATQLNSNVELKTWLDSLGADKMTKEANLAILENISNRYLKAGSRPIAPITPTVNPTTSKVPPKTGNPLVDKYLTPQQ